MVAKYKDGTMDTIEASSHACVFPHGSPATKWDVAGNKRSVSLPTSVNESQRLTIEQWIPAAEWDEKIRDPEMVASRYQQDMGERPRYEDDFPIYRWESNIKGVDTWVKINDAAGNDTLIGDQSSLISQSRMVVTRDNSLRHSDEHLLKMLGVHPKR